MWLEIILGLIAWAILAFLGVKIFHDIEHKKQQRRYKEEDDKGRKGTIQPGRESIISGSAGNNYAKSEINDAVQSAKRELLQSRDVGEHDSDSTEPVED